MTDKKAEAKDWTEGEEFRRILQTYLWAWNSEIGGEVPYRFRKLKEYLRKKRGENIKAFYERGFDEGFRRASQVVREHGKIHGLTFDHTDAIEHGFKRDKKRENL